MASILRKMLGLITILVIVLSISGAVYVHAQDGVNAWTTIDTNLRTGPGRNFDVMTTLPTDVPLILEARSGDRAWVLVHSADNVHRGWIIVKLLKFATGVNVSNLPVSEERFVVTAPPPTTGDSGGGNSGGGGSASLPPINAPNVPAMSAGVRSAMRAIYAKGQALGNNPHVFVKVGDCNSASPYYMHGFGNGAYNLGEYGYLQDTINFFNVSPREGVGNPFNENSLASHNGFGADGVLRPEFADPNICQPDESPLTCQYRLSKPSVAIIMFGTADVPTLTVDQFRARMNAIVTKTLERGIIPVLSTFPEYLSMPEKSRQLNQVVLSIARAKALPVMNLQGSLEGIPNKGLASDGVHLTPEGLDYSVTFNFADPNNFQYGYTVRNLLVLQSLDLVRRQVIRQ